MPDFRISKTVAHWLVGLCTKLVQDGTGRNWIPLNQDSTIEESEHQFFDDITDQVESPQIREWLNALLIVAKTVAGILAYQIDPMTRQEFLEAREDFNYGLPGFEPDDSGMDNIE